MLIINKKSLFFQFSQPKMVDLVSMFMYNSGKIDFCIFVKNDFCIYIICLDIVGYIMTIHFQILATYPKTKKPRVIHKQQNIKC